ncbi:MAG: type II secretion system protein GspL [Hyphomonadaceae bacterium]
MSSPVLVLIAGDTPDAPITWVKAHLGARTILARGVLEDGAAVPGVTGDCILVLPGFEAQLQLLETPARSAAQAKAAAAYLFKGALATSESDTLFAVGEPSAVNSARLVAAIGRSRLAAWLGRCARSRLTPQAIYPDCALWPASAGTAHVVRLGERTLVSAGASGGFTIESDLAPTLLGSWLAQRRRDVTSLSLNGWSVDQLAVQMDSTLAVSADMGSPDPADVLALAAAAMPAGAPNLALNTTEASRRSGSPLTPWLLAASLAVAAGIAQIGVTILDGAHDAEAATHIAASAEADFRAARPDVSRITNLRAQVTAALNSLTHTAANPVLAVSPAVSDMLVAHPDVQLEEIRHEVPGRAVSLRFSSMLPAELDAAVAALRQTSPQLNVGPMQAIDGRSSVTISMGAA